MAAELAPTTTVGGDMLEPAGAMLGANALAAPCRLQLLRLSAGCAAGWPDPENEKASSVNVLKRAT